MQYNNTFVKSLAYHMMSVTTQRQFQNSIISHVIWQDVITTHTFQKMERARILVLLVKIDVISYN